MYNLYTLFPANFGPPSEGYPYGTPRNSSSAGAKDGSPWNASVMKDIFGAMWAVLESGGETADGTAESASSSQFVTAIHNMISGVIRNTLFQKIVTPSMLLSSLDQFSGSGWSTIIGSGNSNGAVVFPKLAAASTLNYGVPFETQNDGRPGIPSARAVVVISASVAALPNGQRPQIRMNSVSTGLTETVGIWVEVPASAGLHVLEFARPSITPSEYGSWVFQVKNGGTPTAVGVGNFRVLGLFIDRYTI